MLIVKCNTGEYGTDLKRLSSVEYSLRQRGARENAGLTFLIECRYDENDSDEVKAGALKRAQKHAKRYARRKMTARFIIPDSIVVCICNYAVLVMALVPRG